MKFLKNYWKVLLMDSPSPLICMEQSPRFNFQSENSPSVLLNSFFITVSSCFS
jgi:hypothetical protein